MKTKNIFLKRFFVAILMTCFCLVAKTGTAAAATYYVATNGNDSNPGTQTQPFETIQKAANIVNPGDIVIVRNGIYTYTGVQNNYMVSIRRSGTAAAPIIFKAENVGGAVLDGNNSAHSLISITGPVASYITIEGFEIRNARWGGIIQNIGNNHHITISRNHIHHIGNRMESSPYGIVGIFTAMGSHDFIVDSNLIHDIGRLGGRVADGDWIDHGWYMHGNFHTAINNIFYNCKAGWSVLVCADCNGANIINNTFIGANPLRDGQIVVSNPNGLQNLLISNNIFYQPRGAGIWWWSSEVGQHPTAAIVRNNISTNAIDSVYGSNAIRAGITYSNNLENTDPKLVNAAGLDFHLQSTSPAIDAGNATDAPHHDYYQHIRPQGSAADVGAYEYTFNLVPISPTSK